MTNNNEVREKTKTENAEELERKAERRKGYRSFLEVMITICIIAISILSFFIVFPLPREVIDYKTTIFFLMELLAFFPFTYIIGMVLSISGRNRKENSDIIIRFLIYMGSYALLGNVIILFLLRNIG